MCPVCSTRQDRGPDSECHPDHSCPSPLPSQLGAGVLLLLLQMSVQRPLGAHHPSPTFFQGLLWATQHLGCSPAPLPPPAGSPLPILRCLGTSPSGHGLAHKQEWSWRWQAFPPRPILSSVVWLLLLIRPWGPHGLHCSEADTLRGAMVLVHTQVTMDHTWHSLLVISPEPQTQKSLLRRLDARRRYSRRAHTHRAAPRDGGSPKAPSHPLSVNTLPKGGPTRARLCLVPVRASGKGHLQPALVHRTRPFHHVVACGLGALVFGAPHCSAVFPEQTTHLFFHSAVDGYLCCRNKNYLFHPDDIFG